MTNRTFMQELFYAGELVPTIEKAKLLGDYQVRRLKSLGFVGFLARHKKSGEFRYFRDLVKIEIFHLKLEEVKKITAEYLQVTA